MCKNKEFLITDIKYKDTGKTREDGRYPNRIFCKVFFESEPKVGYCAYLCYTEDNMGNEKQGVLRTSLVEDIKFSGTHVTITTMNTIYEMENLHNIEARLWK